jgi:hypothetical protein
MSSERKLATGALVFMDALGFKGIWRHSSVADDPTKVLRKLEDVQEATRRQLETRPVAATPDQRKRLREAVRFAFISDTVVIAVEESVGPLLLEMAGPRARGEKPAPWQTINAASIYAASVIGRMACSPAPLAMRGAITWGRFAVSASFVVGPAVDEAAECAGQAEAALVWLAPSAAAHWSERAASPLLRWPVPLKAGTRFSSFAVSPFHGLVAKEEPNIDQMILRTFDGGRLDVQVKRQQTAAFLDAAKKVAPKGGGP